MGFGGLEWFYGRGYELIGVALALAYGCGLIDLVVGCWLLWVLCRGLRSCGGWFPFFFNFFFMLLSAVVKGEKLRP